MTDAILYATTTKAIVEFIPFLTETDCHILEDLMIEQRLRLRRARRSELLSKEGA